MIDPSGRLTPYGVWCVVKGQHIQEALCVTRGGGRRSTRTRSQAEPRIVERGRTTQASRQGKGESLEFNPKPAMGSTPPWAEVTPALSTNRKMARSLFLLSVSFQCHSRAKRRIPILSDCCSLLQGLRNAREFSEKRQSPKSHDNRCQRMI